MERQVVVITGASSGIGASLARELGREGHHLVLAARREPELKAVAADSGDARAVVTDVTVREQVERLRDAALEAFGHVDVWVNNAGRGLNKKVLELTDADVDEMMAVNLKSALYGMQAIVPHFQERGRGHLINISSFLGRVPFTTHRSAFSAAKAALNVLTSNLRADLAATHPGIKVSLLLPGPVATEFSKVASGGLASPPSRLLAIQYPDEVADTIAGVMESPRAEVFTTPTLKAFARRYLEDPEGFDAGMAAPALAAPNLAALAERLKKRE